MIVKSIADLIRGRPVHGIAPEATVSEAAALLDRHDIGALCVFDGRRLAGVLSERDIIRRCLSAGRRTKDTTVADIMTPDPVTIDRNESLAAAQDAMHKGHFRHLPVTDRTGEVVGILSMRDIPTEYRLMAERFREYTAPTAAH